MPKTKNQKYRILKVYRLLYENESLTMDELINELEEEGIYTDRRTLYDDIKVLNTAFPDSNNDNSKFNIVIEKDNHKPVSYYLKNREFTPSELSLVKDSIQSFRYISIAQTNELLDKLDRLATENSTSDNSTSNIPTYAKQKDNITLSNLKVIKEAIQLDRCISCENRYTALNPNMDDSIGIKTKGQRRNWVSPFSIIFADGFYHLIAVNYSENESERELIRYRIDRLQNVKLRRIQRQGHNLYDVFKRSSSDEQFIYLQEGKSEWVKLHFDKELLDYVIERFGENTESSETGRAHLEAYVPVAVDEEFLGWLFSFGKRMYVKSPHSVTMDIKKYLSEMRNMYK